MVGACAVVGALLAGCSCGFVARTRSLGCGVLVVVARALILAATPLVAAETRDLTDLRTVLTGSEVGVSREVGIEAVTV